uniref:Cytochrome P450 n=1 Tax=Candidatus Actinomarina minuta TaxID=1389454 RepID=S5DJB8_9ACTN|nr:cytochrome P450 [Candidatus Actinomarina minuta]
MTIPEIDFPSSDLDFIKDPYPYMKDLREMSPVVIDKTTDLQLVTRFDGVKNIQTSKNFSSSPPNDLEGSGSSIIDPKEYEYFWKTEEFSLLNLEGQLHGDLRNLVAKAFSNRQVQELRPFMENKSSSLLESLKGEEFDLLKDYAQPYSISVIGKLLGVPEDMFEKFLDWSNKIVKMYDLKVSDEDSADAENAAKEFYEYTLSLIDQKVSTPGDDMITRLANVTENNQKLTKNQIICTVILLLNAGHEATVNTIGNSIVMLANNNIDTLNLDKTYNIKNIIEELIRFDSPLQFFQRWVLDDDYVGGVEVKKYSKVAILLGSANRDADSFMEPDQINFERSNLSHTSFGGGVHFCLGAHLARLELEVSFHNLFSNSILLESQPERTGAFGIRGYKEIKVKI